MFPAVQIKVDVTKFHLYSLSRKPCFASFLCTLIHDIFCPLISDDFRRSLEIVTVVSAALLLP